MLISRQELAFDFGDARFDFSSNADRLFLGWVFNQFLYGEVTGIQCGHWLYRAPHLNAASFLAKQAGEELSHVRKILRILSILGEKPAEAHRAIRFLSTGLMGESWGQHVALEMALGEGLVLTTFYALADTITQPEIKKILESAIVEEERHVEFGERETASWLAQNPRDKSLILGLALVQLIALQQLKRFISKRLVRTFPSSHPVIGQFERFYDHVLKGFETRMQKLNLTDSQVARMPGWYRFALIASLPVRILSKKFRRRNKLLTSTYLTDPTVEAESRRLLTGD